MSQPKAIIAFQSDGGSVIAGIEIGKIIRLRNFATLVPDNVRCASACALAWLGGAMRFMGADAQIGFHAAYVVQSGIASETGSGNALVGAYLANMGLPDSAVIYATQAAPTAMTWLNISEAQQKGIDVALFAPSQNEPPHAPRLPKALPSTQPPPTQRPIGPTLAEPLKPIPLDISKLKWSDVRQPYKNIQPETFELNISNAGSDRVSELVIGFRRSSGQDCSRNFDAYDGFKRFTVDLAPGDSVTLTTEFSAQAQSFCIIRALGPPEGPSACVQISADVPSDAAIGACTRSIKSGEIRGDSLAEVYFFRGFHYASRGDLDQAMGDFTAAISLRPGFSLAHYNRGVAYNDKHEFDRAIADFTEAIRLNPSPPFLSGKINVYLNRGAAYLAKGDLDRAFNDFTEAIRFEPGSVMAHYRRADIYMQKRDYVRAAQSYDEVTRLLPNNALIWNKSCWARTVAGQQLQKALANCNESLRLKPDNPSTLDSRGLTYFRLGQLDRAIVDFDSALKLNPNLAGSLYGRGIAKRQLGDLAGSAADLAAAKSVKPDIAEESGLYGIRSDLGCPVYGSFCEKSGHQPPAPQSRFISTLPNADDQR
jgi:tetratricopeptide (TPR) repeat protein